MVLLCILDGFGLREATFDNAVAAAHKPNYERILESCPHGKLDGSGKAVGLPDGQMGNSEVGHLNLGAGRVIYQDISRIDQAIADGTFFKNDQFVSAMKRAAKNSKAVHLFGLVSDGGVHSSMEHLFALVWLANQQGVTRLFLHACTDGRDTPPRAGKEYLAEVMRRFDEIGLGRVATVMGRYYGMDRDRRWERIDKAVRAMFHGEGERYVGPLEAVQASYDDDVTDEFILPRVISSEDNDDGRISDGDTVVMFNFRSDRVRQMSHVMLGDKFDSCRHDDLPAVELVTMTQYATDLSAAKVAFPPIRQSNILGEVLSKAGKKQLRSAETEKYAHVTFFFNGGVEEPYEGEDRELVASPKVATYDLQPEMSSVEVTDKAVAHILSSKYDFVLLNYANCDMVGHTGDFEAAKAAVEAVDIGLGRLLEAVKKQKGVAIVTADHGNAEQMYNPETQGPWTAHTTNLVPCILFDPSGCLGDAGSVTLRSEGILADIAPTLLDILDINVPEEMTGRSLLIRG